MGLEAGTYISDFVRTNPLGGDDRSTADDHLRLIKDFILNTFPNISNAVNPTHTELNFVDGVTSAIQAQFGLKAPLAAPSFTGIADFAGQVRWSKGADVASAAALNLGADGNMFDITGSNDITSIVTEGEGSFVILHFDGVLTLTHNATDLILPDGLDIRTYAGLIIMLYEYSTDDWRYITSNKQSPLRTKVLDIGDWDMTATGFVDIAHGLTKADIRLVAATILGDTQSNPTNLEGKGGLSSGSWTVDNTDIRLSRIVTGPYDNASYDSTSFNRGWIIIHYV